VGNAKIILLILFFSALAFNTVQAEPDTASSLILKLNTTSDWTHIQITGIGDIKLLNNTKTPQEHNLTISTTEGYLSIWVGKPRYCIELTHLEITLVTINPTILHINISKGYLGYVNLSLSTWTGTKYQEITKIYHRNTIGDPSHNRHTETIYLESDRVQLRKIRTKQKEALAVYYPWYGEPDAHNNGRHWGTITQNGFSETVNTPILGAYDSHNVSLIAEHIRLASEHGITGFASSWWGIDSYEDIAFQHILDNRYGFKACVYYETNRDNTLSQSEIAYELNYIINQYGDHENYLKYRDKPVIFVFNADGYGRDAAFWRNVAPMIDDCVLVGDFRKPSLIEVFDGVHIYNEFDPLTRAKITSWIAAQNTILPPTIQAFNEQSRNGFILCDDRLTIGTVSPGYDDTRIRENGSIIPRHGNETYRGYWENIHGSELDWVIITSWNEWHEGTEIEPSIENGYDALCETRKQLMKLLMN
jgi:hypothetical protein